MHGVVARALGSRNVGQLLRSGRGLGEHRTLTSAEEDFKRGQLKDAKVPEAVRQRIAQSLERRMGGDSPMLRLIRESVALHAAEQVGALPTDQLKALNKALVEENDQLILAARQGNQGPWTAARAECRWRRLKEMLSLPCPGRRSRNRRPRG